MKHRAWLLLVVGLTLLLFGWRWGRLQGYAWKGNFEYRAVATEEIPRPFGQHFQNYVKDQWPFVIALGAAGTVCGIVSLVGHWRKR